jgi:hypothetical protein
VKLHKGGKDAAKAKRKAVRDTLTKRPSPIGPAIEVTVPAAAGPGAPLVEGGPFAAVAHEAVNLDVGVVERDDGAGRYAVIAFDRPRSEAKRCAVRFMSRPDLERFIVMLGEMADKAWPPEAPAGAAP